MERVHGGHILQVWRIRQTGDSPIAHPDGFMVAVVPASGGYYHSARCAFPVIRDS